MKTLLFDLDGTLTDPKIGITTCIRHALEKMQKQIPGNLDWCIGPPLHESFAKLLNSSVKTEIDLAISHYRERFGDVGMFENAVYPGVGELLAQLKSAGYKMYVCTSKPHVYARKIVEHFGLRNFFIEIYGSELDGTRTDKADLIKYILTELKAKPANFVMIGDRKHDLIGAHKNGLEALGILWGYGSREELEGVPHRQIFLTPQDLGDFLIKP